MAAKPKGKTPPIDASRLLAEAERVREAPGIVFADGVAGRVPRMAGTGIEVFEVIKVYQAVGQDFQALQECFDWLNERQLRAALCYYEKFRSEVDERLAEETWWDPGSGNVSYPFVASTG